MIKAGLGAGAAGLLLPNGALPALAQQKTSARSRPGVGGSSVFVGAICPLTGPYRLRARTCSAALNSRSSILITVARH